MKHLKKFNETFSQEHDFNEYWDDKVYLDDKIKDLEWVLTHHEPSKKLFITKYAKTLANKNSTKLPSEIVDGIKKYWDSIQWS